MILEYILNPIFYISAFIALIIKFLSWIKVSKSNNHNFQNLQFRYFLVFFTFTAALNLQSPFVFKLYMENGLNSSQIALLQVIYNFLSSFFGFLVGPILEILGHRYLLFICIIISIISTLLRSFGGISNFYLASILLSFSAPMNKVSFEDWFSTEELFLKISGSNFIFSENNAFLQLVVSVISAFFGNLISNFYSTKTVFLISIIILIIASILSLFFIPLNLQIKKKDSFFNKIHFVFSQIKDKKILSFIPIDFLWGLVPLIFLSRLSSFFILKDIKLPLASITGTYSVSNLFGILFLSYLSKKNFNNINLIIFFFIYLSILFFLMYNFFDNKDLLFLFINFAGISEGIINTLILGFRKNLYPSEIRAHLMGIIKFFTSLTASILILYSKNKSSSFLLFLSSFVALIGFICSIIMLKIYEKIQQKIKNN